MKIIDPDQGDPDQGDPDELTFQECDFSGLECPRCHASGAAIDILRLPSIEESKSWWAKQSGKPMARCSYCGCEFSLILSE